MQGTSTKKLRLDVRRAQEEELLEEVLEEEDLIPKHIHEAIKRKLKAAQDELEAVKGHLQGQSVQNVLPTSSCCCKEEDYVALRAEVKELRRLNKDLQRSLLCKAFATGKCPMHLHVLKIGGLFYKIYSCGILCNILGTSRNATSSDT